MKVLVCGGRDYSDSSKFEFVMNRPEYELIITGDASGADTLARLWAFKAGVPVCIWPALWSSEGPAAGPLRNGRMLEYMQPDLVIAFPGGRGTADMIRQAWDAGVDVQIVE